MSPTTSSPSLNFTDLVRRNRETLTTLRISVHLIATITFEDQRQSGVYVSAHDLVLGSSLVSLSLSELCITRDTFSAILQSSPSLLHLSLSRVMVLANNPMLVHFQHESIKTLSATFAQVWTHDDSFDESPTSPSLLIHFPCLQAWSVLDTSPTTYPVPIEKLRTELLDNCPRMKRVQFSTSDHGCLSDFLNNGFERLESCTFGYTCLDSTTLLGFLQHQETLTSIALTLSIAVSDLSKPDPNPAAKSLIGLLARSCRRLEILSIEGHHMDVASMERHEWVCIDLKELRVRFQGLDSIGLINGCLDRLSARKSKGEGLVEESDEGGDSVGKRVCRQLLRFKKLRTVWLGTRDYYLATQ